MVLMRLTLYVSGGAEVSARSGLALWNLERLASRLKPHTFDLKIVDVLQEPAVAEVKKILATPTLERNLPLPSRRFIGDLSDLDAVMVGLHMTMPSDTFTSDPLPQSRI
jgi:circadian clock protein KaiB